jgi:hypothetical protein
MDCRVKPGNDSGEAVPPANYSVMPGLGPGIHVLVTSPDQKTWMAGTSPAMTMGSAM